MQKYKYLQKLVDAKVVAVIRADSKEEALDQAKACLKGGINSIELTFTTPQAEQAIADLAITYPEKSIGAGTVLDQVTAKIAIQNGAQFIVSPSFDKDTALLCNLYQIPYLPGCMTVTEMRDALRYDCSIIKLFPGSIYGPQAINQFKGPLPQLEIMPTGGVNEQNIKEWFSAGAISVGVGGSLTKGSLAEIEEKARKLVAAAN
ncbi:bifunctional 4-hydroxy-2-oxoglutarate aldolase/2-dehydro-3-deoxy-phosphogluconate aldolase [Aquibacillus halophilus]|uniref:Bifunctional 4-hydroxy-2-oxoglutarate aldolase/2-dehydro-3-deoxy-phosphogluconate aldolase n=1 Tax=Aquibacillus halophilus TaxID=930132 RepID=A0A6A8DE41_9BACI|nr:bifunctional 2-keto-4-hydroxyglutarate aldolase/2-keto-3-deoxy-6-phosphogluconate aldolase [Aquibacillus halophilus]MRH43923.1 bifunctional 4-hydroxy-2-oxoglutarate aldolase/2-dehydro-3-deoxy-phosphogluconate aldolase [Aquibacillus halophilus]